MASAGAQAALRGYRLQALYTLGRLLNGDQGQAFQLEGREDLDVIGTKGDVIEFVQVKARAGNLTISAFEPSKSDSFFHRVLLRHKMYPTARESIVSFSPFGPHMARAWGFDGVERAETIQNFRSNGYTESEARFIISRVQLEVIDSDALETDVFLKLRESLVGVDPVAAFELLHAWLFVASELRQRLTSASVRERILAIGRFVSERAAHHDEWFRSIMPLSRTINTRDNVSLREEFYSGVSARFEHIVAGIDVQRVGPLQSIEKAFSSRRLVIVHGASGQGKTALAYRYLHDFVPEAWCFEIRLVESRLHALKITQALLGHLNAIGAPAYVYIDVEPGEDFWLELVKELAAYQHVQILVTIREEDWRRAVSPAALIPLRDVELRFDQSEGRAIYEQLVTTGTPSHVLSFDDAWSRFGGAGPLLEFAYFVARNETLHSRLSNQVRRLRDEVRVGKLLSDELELLRRAAVTTAYGARVDLKQIVSTLNLPDSVRTIDIFEREFLVRVAPNGRYLESLHPIRSELLAQLLTDDAVHPWVDVATRCLASIVDGDLEGFLLHAFTRQPNEAMILQDTIGTYVPQSWTAVAGVVRALLWLAVRMYLKENEPLIIEIQSKYDGAWPFILMADVGNVNAVAPGLVQPLFEEAEWIPVEGRKEFAALRARLTRSGVTDTARDWLSTIPTLLKEPADSDDWLALAEVAFWIHHFGLTTALSAVLPTNLLSRAAEELPLNLAAEVAYGFSFVGSQSTKAALEQIRAPLLMRFQRETTTPVVQDDGQTIRAHFIVGPLESEDAKIANGAEGEQKNAIHKEAMRRITLLRKIVPERQAFGCQGYGHKLDFLPMEYDDSTKAGISSAQLPPRWPLRLNITFIRVGEYIFRPDHWDVYARAVYDKRIVSMDGLELLIVALNAYFRDSQHGDILGGHIVADKWEHASSVIRKSLPYPKDAVDEWGQISESAGVDDDSTPTSKKNTLNGEVNGVALALQRLANYKKAYAAYFSPLSNFYAQAIDSLATMPLLGRVKHAPARKVLRAKLESVGQPSHAGRLPAINLFDASKALCSFQVEFRKRFAQYFSDDELDRFEQREVRLIRSAFSIWYQFIYHPERTVAHAVTDAEWQFTAALSDVRRRFRGRLKKLSTAGIHATFRSEQLNWGQKPALWITLDISDPRVLFNAFSQLYEAIATSLPKAGIYELRHYAVFAAWETIHVIPLVRGRPLGNAGWRLPTLALVGYEIGSGIPWWHSALQSLPEQIFQALDLTLVKWPSLEVVDRLVASATQLCFLIGSANSIDAMLDPTGVGTEVLKDYSEKQSKALSTILSEVNAAVSAMVTFLDEHTNSGSANVDALELLNTIRETLPELCRMLLPGGIHDDRVVPTSEELKDWGRRLTEALPVLQIMRLYWLAYILSELGPDSAIGRPGLGV